jgi:hypothetical protein
MICGRFWLFNFDLRKIVLQEVCVGVGGVIFKRQFIFIFIDIYNN